MRTEFEKMAPGSRANVIKAVEEQVAQQKKEKAAYLLTAINQLIKTARSLGRCRGGR